MRRGVLVVLAVALGACAPGAAGGGGVATTVPSSAPAAPGLAAPVPSTPAGAGVPAELLSPAVTQATLATTVCRAGYSASVRPASSYTEGLRARLLAAYGLDPHAEAELDHIVPLSLGGAPRLPNIFPELAPAAKADDVVENRMHSYLCDGRRTLAEAQAEVYSLKLAHGFRPGLVVR